MNTVVRLPKRHVLERLFRARRENLRDIKKVYGSEAGLARRLGVSPQLLNMMIGENPRRGIGEKFARAAEVALGVPPGWLDINH